MLSEDKISNLKANQTLIGVLNPYKNKEQLEYLAKKKINLFSLELLPRLLELNLWIYCLHKQTLLDIKQL